jgi:alkylation response protein AidB-like acyl-CoA dehydrogenase
MHLAPTAEQQTIPQEARRFLAAEITRERRLEWDKTAEAYDPAFWRAISELGWLGYAIPTAFGGQGASLLDLGLLVEECGRAVAPMALLASFCGSLAIDRLRELRAEARLAPATTRGAELVTLAIAGADAALDPAAFETTVARRGKQLVVDGEKSFVLQGATADAFLVAAGDGRGVSLVHVPRATKGVDLPADARQGPASDRPSSTNVVSPRRRSSGSGAIWPKLEGSGGRSPCCSAATSSAGRGCST